MSYPKLQRDLHEVERANNMQQQQQQYNPQQKMQQQQQRQHPNYPQLHQNVQEEIPLNRLNSVETGERARIREIFNHYDRDGDGHLSIMEMKRLIRSQRCNDIPKMVSKRILEASDSNNDGQLDFEEFYKMSQEHEWFMKDYVVGYCKYIVPRRDPVGAGDEIDGQYERSMVFWPPPLTMIIISIVEVIFFIIDVAKNNDYHEGDLHRVGTSTSGPMATLFIYNPWRRQEAWRFITYMFVHVGVMHILMNLIVQIFLGVALELVHCWWRVLLVYLAGVFAGSMGTSLSNPHIFLAGASGGVYALITAHIATIIMNWHEMEYALIQLFVFLVFCGSDIGTSIYRHLTDDNDRVGYMAHLCGGLAGLLVGIGVLRNLKVRPWERKLWWFAVSLYVSAMTAGICFHIFNPDYFERKYKPNFV